ncbi:MAG: 3-dehydro-L-gulonate 2-dehydrogenase [Bacteroidia bacterium]|nr:3-dehydro-L-gulonate 2-dehydrogenase [Bacteroidia bacterium]
MKRVMYKDMVEQFVRVLEKYGITGDDAALSAKLFADASLEGVYTHGLNRFPKFIASIQNGSVDVHARAVLCESYGMLERWDGRQGPGNLNAWISMQRAIELAKQHTVGIVALKNTNHWMRPGNYGHLACERDCIALMWTNTVPNMPAWGGTDAKLGNNPLVVAVPNADGPVLLDVAMSMFSYGKLEKYKRDGVPCPADAGFDSNGNLTRDPEEVLKTHQVLPIGFWKGAGLSLVLDLIAATLSGGKTTRQIGLLPTETNLSQCFIAIDLSSFPDRVVLEQNIAATLEDLQASVCREEGSTVHYPGQGMQQVRKENLALGIPVDEGIWKSVLEA